MQLYLIKESFAPDTFINSLSKDDYLRNVIFSQLLLCRYADSERQKEPVTPQNNASAHIHKDNIPFAADHHRLFSGSNKRALREDRKPEVIAIDLDESSGTCETLTSRDVGNETRKKRPRRDFADDEREKLLEFKSSCPVVDDKSVTGKIDGIDVIHIDVHENPSPNSSSPVDVTMKTSSTRPIGQALQTAKDSRTKVDFPSPLAVTGNESRKRLEIDATQLDQGDSDTPAVVSPSSGINKNAPSSQNCPKVADNPEDDGGSLRGEAYGHLPDKVRLNDIYGFFFPFFFFLSSPFFFVYCRMHFLILGRSVGKKKKNTQK